MANYPIEDHIRGVVRDLLKTRGIAKTGLIKDINGTRKIPYIGLKNRLSLQVDKVASYQLLFSLFIIVVDITVIPIILIWLLLPLSRLLSWRLAFIKTLS